MDKPLDIFRIVPEGVRWMASVEDLEAVKALVKAGQPGDFVVVNIVTGWKCHFLSQPGLSPQVPLLVHDL